ncbi:hypothetical protein PVK06_032461 [Gossypium arboreum]|uniref:RNase H type-1 domain-containing protein n=1 Tax=Gossypium arboreum TaxID=29729 RepID=A0ABR0NU72_GOSAR|nr:hypothetical protein PVK06_032461 [Gossypium arboreum]
MCPIFEVELWGALVGIRIAWEKGLKKVILELDCLEAVNILNGQDLDQGLLSLKAKETMQQMEGVREQHVGRQRNQVVDGMTALAMRILIDRKVFEEPDFVLFDLVLAKNQHMLVDVMH